MCELQSTIEFSIELYKFYNVDLFQRGMYQVRCSLRVSSKQSVEVEVTTPEVNAGLGTAIVLGNYGACRPFQILYRNEEVSLKDVVLFRCHMLVDANNLKESLERAEFSLILELWFSETSPVSMVMVSSRTLQLNLSPVEGLHYHLPVLFDYFHLSAISLTIHAVLTALHQPSMKRGILRYMQSCAPKSSKSWSKIRSTHCSSLTDPVLPVSSHKIYNKINESSQIHLEARDVLLDASNNLKTIIKEYKILFMQREENLSENYDTLILKSYNNKYETIKPIKKQSPINTINDDNNLTNSSSLAELCADNIRLWNYFLLNFSCKTTIQQYLSRKHHSLRVRRFAELFFLIYNPRRSAIGCFDSNYHNYLLIAELAKRSKYMQNLPQLPVHCTALDGDNTTMPIIFEDQYQDPFEFDKRESEGAKIVPKTEPTLVKRSKTVCDTQCSCGMEDFWEKRKSSENTLVNLDIFNYDDGINTIPTRHSKSLDHLQMCSRNNFHYSLSNNYYTKHHQQQQEQEDKNFYRHDNIKLKPVASEHNMRTNYRTYIIDDDLKLSNNRYDYSYRNDDSICQCNNYYFDLMKKPKKAVPNENLTKIIDSSIDLNQIRTDIVDRKYKQFKIKTLGNVKQCQKIVKSLSTTDNNLNMFRSCSMQTFSPQIQTNNDLSKFNSLITKRKSDRNDQINGIQPSSSSSSNYHETNTNQTNGHHYHENKSSRIQQHNSRRFQIGSTSSSTESVSIITKKTAGLLDQNTGNQFDSNGIRKVRSTPCIDNEPLPNLLSGTESLPNITPKLERNHYPEMKYLSSSTSSTSTTSEQSGWITSRSSSIASSNDVMNTAIFNIFTNIENIQKKIINLSCETKNKNHKIKIDNDQKQGCDLNQSNLCDDIALPPPKQFRDLESPSNSSITNGGTTTNNEEEFNAIDNLLYHVVDTQTTLDRKPSPVKTKVENEDFHFHRGTKTEAQKSFLRARQEFKSQLNFPGILYSDLNTYASAVPYFHISDEFRIFSPEGMHLIICVHGLDGNSADLRLVKTYLELGLPGAYLDFLMSERNQGDTFSDFDTMTDRLVSEILHYLDSSSIRPTRVSFVGHSLGNVIIRSALTRPQMKFLLPRLHTFLSLSGPHLGTLYNSSGLVNMGIWFMQKWKKSGSLLQLCLKDSTDARQSFLYRLSQKSMLHHFKNVLLCGSGQDRYVPLHSARIELCKESMKDTSDLGAIYREMVHNIISPIIAQKNVNLVRYDIHHALPNTANALIGRAAHIAVLDSELFIEKFMAVVGIKYFR